MFKHLNLSIGFDNPQSYNDLAALIDTIKTAAEKDQTHLTYFVIEELTPNHKDVHKP